MNYNPDEKIDGGGGSAEPGQYRFKIDSAEEAVFRTGNEGVKAVLWVAAFEDRDVKVFCNFTYSPKALWRLEQFMQSVGLDFYDKSIQPRDFIGLTGSADFILGEKGYLEVENFLPASANSGAAKRPATSRPAVHSTVAAPRQDSFAPPPSDDVPF